jgi:hypothetical protein
MDISHNDKTHQWDIKYAAKQKTTQHEATSNYTICHVSILYGNIVIAYQTLCLDVGVLFWSVSNYNMKTLLCRFGMIRGMQQVVKLVFPEPPWLVN